MMTCTPDSNSLEVQDFNARGTAAAATKHYGEALLHAARADERIVLPYRGPDAADGNRPVQGPSAGSLPPGRHCRSQYDRHGGGACAMRRHPFVHSFCVFVTRRCYDQVAMQVAYPRANVKIVGVIPGLTTLLGVSHQAIDDIALMRALPNMTVIEPSGPDQVRAAVAAIAAHEGPVYLRLKRADGTEIAHNAPSDFRIGKCGYDAKAGRDDCRLRLMVDIALSSAIVLAADGIELTVVDMATVKPLDPDLVALAQAMPVVVTAENHSIIGGLGSAVAELLMGKRRPHDIPRVGVRDTFAEGGTTPYLFEKYGLSEKAADGDNSRGLAGAAS